MHAPPARTQQTVPEQTHISPINDAVTIVVETNPYTHRDNGVSIDCVRRIVVVEKRRILLNMRVDVSAPSMLSPLIHDRSTRGDIDQPLQTNANIVVIISKRLKTRFCVFYDREYTLDALRFALPRERSVDLGQYVLLRNDALREGGTVWSRSCAYTAFLKDLWSPILKGVVPSVPVEKARRLLELVDGVVKSFHLRPITHSLNWTPAGDWYSRLGRTRELLESLHLELQTGHVESRRQRYGAGRLPRLNEPRRATAPFYFSLAKLPGVGSHRVLVTNRQCRQVSQAGLAMLVCLVNAKLVNPG